MGRLTGLDALRGIAALFVAIGHAEHMTDGGDWLVGGYLAVDFFFLLSGFVLTRTYDRRLNGDLSTLGFMVIRVRRLWPVMAVGALIGLASSSQVVGPASSLLFAVMALLFIPQFWLLPPSVFPANVPAWSISIELAANALHGLLLAKLGNLALAAFAILCLTVMLIFAPTFDVGSQKLGFWLAFPRIGVSYTMGMLLWRMFGDRPLCSPMWAIIAFPGLILSRSVLGSAFDPVIVVFGFPLILVCGLGHTRIGPALGALSFPLYAVHFPALILLVSFGASKWLAVSLAIAVAAGVAWLLEPRRRRRDENDEARGDQSPLFVDA